MKVREILQNAMIRQVEMVFLALTIWREARGESEECQRAVAYSILNRVARPSWWGKDICSVVFKRLQYSSLTYKRDPQLTTWPEKEDDPAWMQCVNVANEAIGGVGVNPVPHADSYFDVSIPAPKWATAETFVGQVGRIRFYNTDHDHEQVVAL